MKRKFLMRLAVLLWIPILSGCSPGKSDGTDFHTPPNYQGIVPGQTTEEQVLSILGEPDQISTSTIEKTRYLEYHTLRVAAVFPLESQIVGWIWIEDPANTLGEVFDGYGKPELIELSNPYECFPDEYMVTSLYYPKHGIVATLWNVPPLSREMILADLLYFEPMTLEAYFERFGPLTKCDKVIEWPGFEK